MPPHRISGTLRGWPPKKDNEDEAETTSPEVEPASMDLYAARTPDSFAERKAELRESIAALEAAAKKDKSQESALIAAENELRKLEQDSKEGQRFFEEAGQRWERETAKWARAENRLIDRSEEESITSRRMKIRAANAEAQEGIRKLRAELDALEAAARSSLKSDSEALEKRGPGLVRQIRALERKIEQLPEQDGKYGKDTILTFFKERMAPFQEGLKNVPAEERNQKLSTARTYMQRSVELSEKLMRVETSNEAAKMRSEIGDILGNYERLYATVVPQASAAEETPTTVTNIEAREGETLSSEDLFSGTEAGLSDVEERLRVAREKLDKIGGKLDELQSGTPPKAETVDEAQSPDQPEPLPDPVPAPEEEVAAEQSVEAPWTGPRQIPIEALLESDDMAAAAAEIEREADRYYDESIARLDFILPYHHRKLSEHRTNIGYLARDIGPMKDNRKRRKLIAELKNEVAAMHTTGLEIADKIHYKENHVPLRDVAPQAYAGQPEPGTERPEKKPIMRRKRTWLGIAGLLGLGYLATQSGGESEPQPNRPVASSPSNGNSTTSRSPATPSPSREAAQAGAPESSAASIEVRVVDGRGAERLFGDLQAQLRQHYGSRTDKPANVERILAANPATLAEQLGFSASGQSRIMLAGERLSVDSHGILRFHYLNNRQPVVLINERGEVRQVEGVMVPNRAPVAARPAPSDRSEIQTPVSPETPDSLPEIEVVDGQAPRTSPRPRPTAVPQPPVTPEVQAPAPRRDAARPLPADASASGTPQRPESRAPQTAPESAPGGAAGNLERSPLWATNGNRGAYELFDTPAAVGSAEATFRQGLFNLMKESGVGPRDDETTAQYVTRARESARRGGVVTPVIVHTPGRSAVARGGDFNARLMLARTFLRQLLGANPDTPPERVYILMAGETGSIESGFAMSGAAVVPGLEEGEVVPMGRRALIPIGTGPTEYPRDQIPANIDSLPVVF